MRSDGVAELLSPVLAQFSLDLEEVDITPAGKRRVVRVVVDGDGPDGRGPDLDDIAEATRAISSALDESDLVGAGAYTLEVTSRGVSRPLTLPRHWRRNVGRLVEVRLADGSVITGRVVDSDEEQARLQPGGEGSGTVSFDQVERAVVQVEMRKREREEG